MKQKLLFVVATLTSIVISSCQKQDAMSCNTPSDVAVKSTSDDLDYSKYAPLLSETVSIDDAMLYAKAISMHSGKDIVSVTPHIVESDTVAYFINYSEGWEMISANRKIGLGLIRSKTGQFVKDEIPEELKYQIEEYSKFIKNVPESCDPNYTSSSYETWVSLHPELYTTSNVIKTKGPVGPPTSPIEFEPILELVDIVTLSETTTGPSHLIETRWHQNSPWNQYCPTAGRFSTDHCLACCVAITGAQMLYFLHNKLGTTEAPNGCVFSGYSTYGTNEYPFVRNYTGNCYQMNSDDWDKMAKTSTASTDSIALASALIAWVGNDLAVDYGATVSLAYRQDLVGTFSRSGINSTYSIFDGNVVHDYIYSTGIPVAVGAYPPEGSNGHVWIVDGAQTFTGRYENHWELVCYDNNGNRIVLDSIIDRTHYYEEWFTMNWGWNTSHDSLTYAKLNDWRANGYTFSYSRANSIYNFTLINE